MAIQESEWDMLGDILHLPGLLRLRSQRRSRPRSLRVSLLLAMTFIFSNAYANDTTLLKCMPHHPTWCIGYAVTLKDGRYIFDRDKTRSAPLDDAEMQDVVSHLIENHQTYQNTLPVKEALTHYLYDVDDTALELIYTGNAGQAYTIINLALSNTIIDKGAVFIRLINQVRHERYGTEFLAMSGIK